MAQMFPKSMMDAKVVEYAGYGMQVLSRTDTQIQFIRRKTFNFWIALLGLLTFGVITVLYVFYYLAKRDETETLTFYDDTPKGRKKAEEQMRIMQELNPQVPLIDWLSIIVSAVVICIAVAGIALDLLSKS